MKKFFLLVVCAGVLVPLVWIITYKYEKTPPKVDVTLPSVYLNEGYELSLHIKDKKTGLRHVLVTIMQQQNEKKLLEKTYPAVSVFNLFSGEKTLEDNFLIPVESRRYGMNDGEAVIRIQVSDQAWRKWNKGNVFLVEKKVIIDTEPPRIQVLSQQHNVERGGAGLVIYRLFEKDVKSGVMVGERFFPGHAGMFDQKDIFAAFFALDHTQGPGTRMWVTAEDMAGNTARRGFYHYIRDRNFKSDVLNISDRFLESKMPDFNLGKKESRIAQADNPLLEKFQTVNTALRKANVKKVLSVPADTVNQVLWKEKFDRMPGSATRAGFGDQRTYTYKGKKIGESRHMGIDLASTARARVEAANSGQIIMAEAVGIFGNTVIIDHGFGLASLYSHLSSMAVSVGDMVKKGDHIGNTGLTGLAGGDHLHFSMIVHNVFVNPVEWWDPNWIKNNVTSKIKEIKQSSLN
ncbi:MAG: M23 family metallopeptidase [Desulfotignum sp.]|nr:M23 family metallopeptidase [Desulfotignum sp.]MCF8125497.1 M23 family metallopeptidase [Desulfotignum sp.]